MPSSKIGRLRAYFESIVNSAFLILVIVRALSKHKRNCDARGETLSARLGFQCNLYVVSARRPK